MRQLLIASTVAVMLVCGFVLYLMVFGEQAKQPAALATSHSNVKLHKPSIPDNHIYSHSRSKAVKRAGLPADPDNPSVEIIIRTFYGGYDKMEKYFIPSIDLFWNSILPWSITVILDDEGEEDKIIAKKMLQHPLITKVEYEKLPKKGWDLFHGKMRLKGYDRQQYSTFITDLFVTSDVIGLMDTDSAFLTVPVKGDYLRNGKLLVVGNQWSSEYTASTRHCIHEEPIGMFMNSFPMFFWSTTLYNLRQYLKELHNSTFEDAFRICSNARRYSQFDIIFNYAWHFERDRYEWHLEPAYVSNTPPGTFSPALRIAGHKFLKLGRGGVFAPGCCFSFFDGLSSSCLKGHPNRTWHQQLLKWNGGGVQRGHVVKNDTGSPWMQCQECVTSHYRDVQKDIGSWKPGVLEQRQTACLTNFLMN